jgi:hypothetical protein
MAVWGSDAYGTVQSAGCLKEYINVCSLIRRKNLEPHCSIIPDQLTQTKVENLLAGDHTDMNPRRREMPDEFPKFREEILPSKYWAELNK